jgi:cupin 2 domain-containing protein
LNLKNIYKDLPNSVVDEIIEPILESGKFKVERIVSEGHHSEKDFWYDQSTNEFILLLKGNAIIKFETEEAKLNEGDYLIIPAHKRHRVEWTDPKQKTFWLAIHY